MSFASTLGDEQVEEEESSILQGEEEEEEDSAQIKIICTDCGCTHGDVCDVHLEEHYADSLTDISIITPKSTGTTTRTTSASEPAFKISAKLTPFFMRWCYGVNVAIPLCNLTTTKESAIFYASSHAGLVYDYAIKSLFTLQGHQNAITALSAGGHDSKYLVTADSGDPNHIIIWDAYEFAPILDIQNPHPKVGTALVEMSHTGKYLISVSKNKVEPTIDLRVWSKGAENPEFRCQAGSFGKVKKICFNQNVEEHIMIGFEKQIIFLTFDPETSTCEKTIPHIADRKNACLITDCTYVENCHESLASTSSGCILVFGNTYYSQSYSDSLPRNSKTYIKTIRVSEGSITCITSIDGMVVTADEHGRIKFYDNRVRILYWCQNFNLPSICAIKFDVAGKKFKLKDFDLDTDTEFSTISSFKMDDTSSRFEDRSGDYDIIYKHMVPSDYTLQKSPFYVRDFIVSCVDGNVYRIDFMENTCTDIFFETGQAVAAIDAHAELPILCIAYSNGMVAMHNYMTHELIHQHVLPESEEVEENGHHVQTTCLKFSPKSLHLAVGRSNGNIWMLDQTDLAPKKETPLHGSTYCAQKLCFSTDNKYFAYYDSERTVCLFFFNADDCDWNLVGKTRTHYKPITDMTFTTYSPPRLFTISEDRTLVEYAIASDTYELPVLKNQRIEQTAVPLSFFCYPIVGFTGRKYLFVANDELKYKLIDDQSFKTHSVVMGPAYPCFGYSPIHKLMLLPHQDTGKYFYFATDKHLGIQMLPADGNPFKYNGIIGHPKKIKDFCISNDGKTVFTFGNNDRCVIMWAANTSSVEILKKFGGSELEPYYCLIEGGKRGWLFSEMQDLFYYMQILYQGENTMLPREVNDYIPITELPDLMRACGFYLSDFEADNLIQDISERDFDVTTELRENVSFFEFVQLYVNHKPARGLSMDQLRKSFDILTEGGYGTMTKEEFVEAMTSRGEEFTNETVKACLMTLMRQALAENLQRFENSEVDPFWFLPSDITFECLTDDILGIDMENKGVGIGNVQDDTEDPN